MKYEIKPELERILLRLKRKDKEAYVQIKTKIAEVVNSDPEHYKNLMYDLKSFKRVHIKKSFILIFKYDEENQFISFWDYDHHDKIYKKKYLEI